MNPTEISVPQHSYLKSKLTGIIKIFDKIFKGFRNIQFKHKNKWWHLCTSTHCLSLRKSIPKSLAEWSWMHFSDLVLIMCQST